MINALLIKNLSPRALVKLHRKRREELEKQQEEKKNRELMKINYDIDKRTHGFKKYYAIILSDELVVTDKWDKALNYIDGEKDKNFRVRYKSFTSISAATDFLRG